MPVMARVDDARYASTMPRVRVIALAVAGGSSAQQQARGDYTRRPAQRAHTSNTVQLVSGFSLF